MSLVAVLAAGWGASVSRAAGQNTAAGAADADIGQVLEELVVTAERLHVSDVEGVSDIERFDATQIEDAGVFSLDEYFDTLPPGEEGEEQLVLINGEPAYLDPSQLPLDMVEGVDVSVDGSMPEFGARSRGRVINIRLKKDYQGAELGGRWRTALAGGGGDQLTGRASASVVRGKLRALVTLSHDTRHALFADERTFSREQDHTARGGRDLRLSWGFPAVVQATDGPLAGLTDASGAPVFVALTPEFQAGDDLTAGDFLPGSPLLPGAADQRRFNSAGYRMLMSPGRRMDGTFALNYAVSPRLHVAFTASLSESRTQRRSAPPVSEASDETLVPAAFNPFGQEVSVGLVHVEFGPTFERGRTRSQQLGLQAGGRFGGNWRWSSGVEHRSSSSLRTARDLDDGKFAAALASPDPATRFNPFGDPRVGPVNAHLYPSLVTERTRDESTAQTRVDTSLTGDIARLPGGPVRFTGRSQLRFSDRDRAERNLRDGDGDDGAGDDERTTRQRRHSQSLTASASLPLIGEANAHRWARRLTAEIEGEYATGSDAASSREGEFGFAWAPVKQLVLRAGIEVETESASRVVEERPENLVGELLVDPRRDAEVVSGVEQRYQDVIAVAPESGARRSFGFSYEPGFVRGLRFSGRYDSRVRRHLYEDELDLQDVVNNEAGWAYRVIRAEPTADDIARGRPGRIVAVDLTPGEIGAARTSDVDFSVDYRVPVERWGRIRLRASGTRLLDARREIAPGVPFLDEASGRFNPPDWRLRGMLSWAHAGWNSSLRFNYTGAVPATAIGMSIPAHTNVDLTLGYRLREPLRGKFGRGLRVMLGIGNLFDTPPPFADTVDGYRGGSPLGRTTTLSFTLPL